jgi:hypothetical protein
MRAGLLVQCGLPDGGTLRHHGPTAKIRRIRRRESRGRSKRKSPTDKARIFNIAESEAAEVLSTLDLAERLRYGRQAEARRLCGQYDELLAMIESLCQRILRDSEDRP